MQYTYEDTSDGNKKIEIMLPETTVIMILDPNEPDHATMINSFTDQVELEKYVAYLASKPDRPFRINEITNL